MIRNITIRKYELFLHITIVCMHDVSEICMVLCIYLCYRLYNISLLLQELQPGALILLHNNARDGRKGHKLAK